MAIKAESKFSLKDSLFNAETVHMFSDGMHTALPGFDQSEYEMRVLARFPEMELKDRIRWMVTTLHDFLPSDFNEAVTILRKALPEPLDASRTDDDFGHFVWIVPGDYVAEHGCTPEHLEVSLAFLREATMRFTSENAIRPFLRDFPERTLEFMRECARDENYHVRRWASEGIRPYLPWALRVVLPPDDVIEVLELLHADSTRFVTRSVANTLNDLSKDHPDLVLTTLKRWKKLKKQEAAELEWMTAHALRTLVKRDHSGALRMLGYKPNPDVTVSDIQATAKVAVGDAFEWKCRLESGADQRLKVGMKIHFLKANGSLSPKAFAVKDLALDAGESVEITKRQPFKPITTRVLYPGTHRAELVVNGSVKASRDFELLDPR